MEVQCCVSQENCTCVVGMPDWQSVIPNSTDHCLVHGVISVSINDLHAAAQLALHPFPLSIYIYMTCFSLIIVQSLYQAEQTFHFHVDVLQSYPLVTVISLVH